MSNPSKEMLDGITAILMAVVGIAVITLLVNPKSNTKKVIEESGGALDKLLRTLTGAYF